MTSPIVTVNPATGEPLASYDEHSPARVGALLASAVAAQVAWAERPLSDRAEVVRALGRVLRDRSQDLSRLAALEMGKPVVEAEAEVEKCARTCDHFASCGPALLSEEVVDTGPDQVTSVTFEPLGVVLAVEPWNFPFWQVVRFAAPALLAGNAALLKHSPNVSGCALALEDAFLAAGFPPGLLSVLLLSDASTPGVVSSLVDDPRVAAVTLTGSDRAGAAVGASAGRAVKRSVLELGGSDPFIVLSDADLEVAAKQAARARFQNGGQSCIAAKRFLVDASVADRFEELFVSMVSALVVGDPLERSTLVGPLARPDLRDALVAQVERSVLAGATVLVGGGPLPGPGSFFAPTVLSGVTPGMPVFDEETFGPVASVSRFSSEDEAVELANSSPYGLGASVWSRDVDRARRLGRRVTSGSLFVNAVVASDPRLPFGGTKRSGYGRELSSYGLREFTNVRTWWLSPTSPPPPPLSPLPSED